MRKAKENEEATTTKQTPPDESIEEAKAAASSSSSSSPPRQPDEEARRAEVHAWKKSLVSNLLWAPLCLHWSLEKGLGIPSSVTSSASFLAGAWDLCDAWNITALL